MNNTLALPASSRFSRFHRFCNALALCLLVYAFARIAVVVFASPLVGYANNYDFIRSSACTGVWLTDRGQPRAEDSRTTVNELTYTGQKNHAVCMRSIDNLFPRIARWFHDKGESIDFREISLARFVALLLGVVLLVRHVRHAGARLALGAAFALAVADVAVLPYFNSLYLDYSVVAGCFFAVALAAWWSASPQAPGRGALLGAAVAIAWLGLSKNQYGALAAALSVYMAWVLAVRFGRHRAAAAFVVLALAVPLSFSLMNDKRKDHMVSVSNANTANTFLDAVLPAAHDPDAALAALNLPPTCRAQIGFGWFTREFQQNNRCPEIFTASRWKLPGLFWEDPRIFHMPMTIGILKARPLWPAHLQRFEDPATADSPQFQFIHATSLAPAFAALPDYTYFYSVLVLMGGGIVLTGASAALCFVRRPGADRWRMPVALVGLGGTVTLYAIASSVFGDGYSDFQKHAVGMVVGLAFQTTGLVALATASVAAVFNRSGRHEGTAPMPVPGAAALLPHPARA